MPQSAQAVQASLQDGPAVVATEREVPRLSVASGREASVRSPALDLQEALESMLTVAKPRPVVQPAAAISLALGATAVATVCAAFWITLARMVISAF